MSVVADSDLSPETSQNAEKPGPPSPAMPRDRRGWRVTPAPDGRGMPDEHKPTPPHRLRGFWLFFVLLLAVNWVLVLVSQPVGQPRVTVPFSPYFLQQLEAGKVQSISSHERRDHGHVQGEDPLPGRTTRKRRRRRCSRPRFPRSGTRNQLTNS